MASVSINLFSCGAALLTPAVVLAGAQLWFGAGGPTSAKASAAPDAVPFEPVIGLDDRTLDVDQTTAMERALAVQTRETPDPFLRTAVEVEFESLLSPLEPVNQESVVEASPDVTVSAVVAGRMPLAVIDGQPRRVGDRVAGGWSIKSITTSGVQIVHQDGRELFLPLQRPRP